MNFWTRSLLLFGCMQTLWSPFDLQAQTVSIVNTGRDRSAKQVEAYLKTNLRDEGYQVKGGTADGWVVLLNSSEIEQNGQVIGVGGSVVIGSLDWANLADSLLPSECPTEVVAQVKNYLGVDFVLVDSKLEIAGNEKDLAIQLGTVVNDAVRTGSKKIGELARKVGRDRGVYR